MDGGESRLTLNASKTKTCFLDLILSSAKPPLNFLLEIHMLTIVPSFKYLGLHFDQYLSWNLHVDQITKSVTKYIVFVYRTRKYLSQESLKILHNSILFPKIDCCDVVWGNCSKYLGTELRAYKQDQPGLFSEYQ